MGKVTVEVCIDSVESALESQRGGADRVELCDNLMEGGTTPSAGTIEVVRSRVDIRVPFMYRCSCQQQFGRESHRTPSVPSTSGGCPLRWQAPLRSVIFPAPSDTCPTLN